jgi:hypothetical protein
MLKLGDHKLIFVSALKTHPPFDLYSEFFSNRSFSQTGGALLPHTGKSTNLIKKICIDGGSRTIAITTPHKW